MKNLVFFLSFWFIFIFCGQLKLEAQKNEVVNSKYAEIFQDDYSEAIKYLKINKQIIDSVFNKFSINKEIVLSAIFPERIRYSLLRDFFETEALSIVYVDYGSKIIDFSIGDFQIKPSFVEALDSIVHSTPNLKSKYSTFFPEIKDPRRKRKVIVHNLRILKYQLIYICVFYDLLNQYFDLKKFNKLEKIKFTASAYNLGFNKSKQKIIDNYSSEYFPYGVKYPGKQYAYVDIAIDFYINYYEIIFK